MFSETCPPPSSLGSAVISGPLSLAFWATACGARAPAARRVAAAPPAGGGGRLPPGPPPTARPLPPGGWAARPADHEGKSGTCRNVVNFVEKGVAFFGGLCYNVAVALAPLPNIAYLPPSGAVHNKRVLLGGQTSGARFFRTCCRCRVGCIGRPRPRHTSDAPVIPRGRGRAGDGATGPPED